LPNFFGESPAVQVSSAKATLKVDQKTQTASKKPEGGGISHDGIQLDANGVKTRFGHRHPAEGQGRLERPSTRTPPTRNTSSP
jgi:hypothetical protein